MKKLIIPLVVVGIMLSSNPVSAGFLDKLQGSFKETIDPVAYAWATSGYNIRVYEARSLIAPCIVYAISVGEEYKGSMTSTIDPNCNPKDFTK